MQLATRPRAPDTGSVTEAPKAHARSISQSGLFSLLCIATFFEGFDTKLASFVQPVIGADFGASVEELGTALGVSSFGMVLAFFVVLLADTFGRRPIFLFGLLTYAVFTLATAFAPDLTIYTLCQFIGRMAMVVELFLGYLILSEEMPPEIRGRANGFFASTAVLGAAIPAFFLAPLEAIGVGWRGLFLMGSIPLLVFPIYLRRIPETEAFTNRERADDPGRYGEAFFRTTAMLWRSADRSRLVRISGIWFAVNLWSGSALYFFTLYVFETHDWTSADIQWLPLGTIPFGLAGYILSGFAMDALGRRVASTLYLGLAFAATLYCYTATGRMEIYLGFFTLFGLSGVWTILTTWTTELFPTETRATALGLANNLIGRMGLVIGPIAIGQLGGLWRSIPAAVIALGCVTLLVIPLVWMLPETNGMELSPSPNATD